MRIERTHERKQFNEWNFTALFRMILIVRSEPITARLYAPDSAMGAGSLAGLDSGNSLTRLRRFAGVNISKCLKIREGT